MTDVLIGTGIGTGRSGSGDRTRPAGSAQAALVVDGGPRAVRRPALRAGAPLGPVLLSLALLGARPDGAGAQSAGSEAAGIAQAPAPLAPASLTAVEEVAPGVFVRVGRHEPMSAENAGVIANGGFVVGRDGAAVVDPGGSVEAGEGLLAALRARTDLPVTHVIATHMHPDHVFGLAAFRGAGPGGGDPAFVGHGNLPAALAARAEHYRAANAPLIGAEAIARVEVVLPTLTVDDRLTVDLGDRLLELRAWPTAHTNNDLTAFDEATATLFAGDLLFSGHLPALDGSLSGWIAVRDALAAIPADRVVPGHGPASMPWPEALEPQHAYLEGVAEALRAQIARGARLDEAVEAVPPPAGWERTEAFHRRNLTAGFAELEWE